MDRNFTLLGLREDATKAEVKEAYERRLAKYRTADYADDPEYARRKIAELKAAYEKAYNAAGSFSAQTTSRKSPAVSPAVTRESVDVQTNSQAREEEEKRKKEQKEKEKAYERRRSDIDEEERRPLERLRLAKEEKEENKENRELKKPDLSVLKERAEHLKEQGLDMAKKLHDQVEAELEKEGSQTQRVFQELKELGTPNLYNRSKDKNEQGLARFVIGLLVLILTAGVTMCDGSSDVDYGDYNTYDDFSIENDISAYSVYYSDEDWVVHDYAVDVAAVIQTDLDYVEPENQAPVSDETALRKTGDRFVKRYIGFSSLEDWCDCFWSIVPIDATADSSAEKQMETVLQYYGFPLLEEVRGYINPYSGKMIDSLNDYVKYLNRYHKEEILS